MQVHIYVLQVQQVSYDVRFLYDCVTSCVVCLVLSDILRHNMTSPLRAMLRFLVQEAR